MTNSNKPDNNKNQPPRNEMPREKLTLAWRGKTVPVPDIVFVDAPDEELPAPTQPELAAPAGAPVSASQPLGGSRDGTIQRYTRAIGASNLRDDEHHHSTEVLAAVALCRDLGAKLFRVKYAGDSTTYPALLEAWREIVKGKAILRAWPADISPKKVARLSLDYWLNDVCEACTGLAYQHVPGVPTVLSDIACRACYGTGTRPIHVQHRVLTYVQDMVEVLNAMSAGAAGKAMKKLASDMDL